MAKKRKRLGLDCDGVISDFVGYVLGKIKEQTGHIMFPSDWTSWNIRECLGEEAGSIFDKAMDESETWLNLPLYKGIEDYLDILCHKYELYMITSLNPRFIPDRLAWIAKHNLPFKPENIYFVSSSREKRSLAVKLKLDAFIEDLPSTANGMAAAGIKSYLIERPWNKDEPKHEDVLKGDMTTLVFAFLMETQ